MLAHPFCGIHTVIKKEQTVDTYNNLDQLQKFMLSTKECIFQDFIYKTFQEKQIILTKSGSMIGRFRKKKKKLTLRGLRELFEILVKFYILVVALLMNIYQYPKTHQIHHLKQITILGCDFIPQ